MVAYNCHDVFNVRVAIQHSKVYTVCLVGYAHLLYLHCQTVASLIEQISSIVQDDRIDESKFSKLRKPPSFLRCPRKPFFGLNLLFHTVYLQNYVILDFRTSKDN